MQRGTIPPVAAFNHTNCFGLAQKLGAGGTPIIQPCRMQSVRGCCVCPRSRGSHDAATRSPPLSFPAHAHPLLHDAALPASYRGGPRCHTSCGAAFDVQPCLIDSDHAWLLVYQRQWGFVNGIQGSQHQQLSTSLTCALLHATCSTCSPCRVMAQPCTVERARLRKSCCGCCGLLDSLNGSQQCGTHTTNLNCSFYPGTQHD